MGRMWKIYSLTDPRDNQVRYFGITQAKLQVRLARHIHWAHAYQGTRKDKWIRELLKKDLVPLIRLIANTSSKTRALAAERLLVLTTDGVFNTAQVSRPLAQRKKISAANKGKPSPLRGQTNPTHGAKIRKAYKEGRYSHLKAQRSKKLKQAWADGSFKGRWEGHWS